MISLHVNGQYSRYDGDPAKSLIAYLRDDLNVSSLRLGCLMGSCKTCLVYVDQMRALACTLTMADVDQKSVITAEW